MVTTWRETAKALTKTHGINVKLPIDGWTRGCRHSGVDVRIPPGRMLDGTCRAHCWKLGYVKGINGKGKVLHLTSRAIAETPKVLFYLMRHTLLAPSREA